MFSLLLRVIVLLFRREDPRFVVRKTQKNNKIIEVFLSLSSISGLLTTYFLTTHIVCFI